MKVERKEIERKVYGWGGWKMPILHLNDPEYCEYGCPVCTRARNGIPRAVAVQKAQLALTPGGCPWGRARRRKHRVNPDRPIPQLTH